MTWIKAAAEAASYRRMYKLAAEIVGSDMARRDMRKAAKRVMRVLEEVIDLPIADALLLARARRRFSELSAILSRPLDRRELTETASPGQNDRAMELH
ncbi:hypothetical protein KX729_00235 [Rhizobium sp. XQZ8]|uniref:hypothetical protein n=1 Tax=Rhizobium populisoli TaxID=2859785 RepID=UPI001CA4CD77|nr:hypothetical protein [Rhizobium populisoli]MBW6419862.1 hypothetical protein [Rhizobium populisoli]